jgi:hypothetical protein
MLSAALALALPVISACLSAPLGSRTLAATATPARTEGLDPFGLPPLYLQVNRLESDDRVSGFQLGNQGPQRGRVGSFRVAYDGITSHAQADPGAFNQLDRFSFELMEQDGVLTAEQVKFYSALGRRIDPRRVSYVTLNERIPGPPHEEQFLDPSGKLLASLKLVSGQFVEQGAGRSSSRLRHANLPFVDEYRARQPEMVSRLTEGMKGKFVFEASRVGNAAGRGLIGLNFALMAFVAAQETLEQGGKLEDAFIYLHATTEKNGQTFASKYGFERLEAPELEAGHVILRQSVLELLRRYRPENLFFGLEKVRVHLPTESGRTIEFMHKLHTLFEAAIRTRSGGTFLIARDRSFLFDRRLAALCADFSVPVPVARELLESQERFFTLEHRFNFRVDFTPPPNSMELGIPADEHTEFARDPGRYLALLWAEVEGRQAELVSRGLGVDPKQLGWMRIYFTTEREIAFPPGLQARLVHTPAHDRNAEMRGKGYLYELKGAKLRGFLARHKVLRRPRPRGWWAPRDVEGRRQSIFH